LGVCLPILDLQWVLHVGFTVGFGAITITAECAIIIRAFTEAFQPFFLNVGNKTIFYLPKQKHSTISFYLFFYFFYLYL
jgi:hypothetical protein